MPTPIWARLARPSSTTSRPDHLPRDRGPKGRRNRLGNLGNAYADLGETRKAIEYYEQALTIAREIGDRRGEGSRPGQPGQCLRRPGRDSQGHRVLRAGPGHLPRDRGPKGRRRSTWATWALAYADLGETRKAIEYYEQALTISREIGDRRGEGADLGNLGLAYADLGETRKAIEYYEQALAIAREIGDKQNEGECTLQFRQSLPGSE